MILKALIFFENKNHGLQQYKFKIKIDRIKKICHDKIEQSNFGISFANVKSAL